MPLLNTLDDVKIDFFQVQLLEWFKENGRHDLPWKPHIKFSNAQNIYRIWLSEIMLQQTQVVTVLDYFERFTQKFPQIEDLAAASIEEVLVLWAGLGYYSRARNLHACSQQIVSNFGGIWPTTIAQMMTLKGIGRTTSAAILSQGFNIKTAIVDGNVKRVLSRFLGCDAPANMLEKVITPYAEILMHPEACADYTQAIMDFGASICTKKPKCIDCPIQSNCYAYQSNSTANLPVIKLKKAKPIRHTIFCIIQNSDGQILLEKRPDKGIWGGLWSLPEIDYDESIVSGWLQISEHITLNQQNISSVSSLKLLNALQKHIELEGGTLLLSDVLSSVKHQFTHYSLILYPIVFILNNHALNKDMDKLCDEGSHDNECVPMFNWHDQEALRVRGLPKPIQTLLDHYFNQSS